MNVFLKNAFKVALIILAIGLCITIIAVSVGGDVININNPKNTDLTETYTNVKSLVMEIGASNIEVRESNEFKIDANHISKKGFKSYVSDGTWYIKENSSPAFLNFFGDDTTIIIYLPKDFISEKLKIDIGAANFNADKLAANKADIKVGAANLKVNELITEDIDIECGVGNVEINGKIQNNARIKCGVGNVTLNLLGNEKNYNYDFNVGLGSIVLNNNNFSGITEKVIDNEAIDREFKVEVGVGKVGIKIEE